MRGRHREGSSPPCDLPLLAVTRDYESALLTAVHLRDLLAVFGVYAHGRIRRHQTTAAGQPADDWGKGSIPTVRYSRVDTQTCPTASSPVPAAQTS